MKIRVNGTERIVEEGTTYFDLALDTKAEDGHDALLAYSDGRLRELHHKVKEGNEIRLISAMDPVGFETYRRSVVMLFQTALANLSGVRPMHAVLHFSMDAGFFLTINEMEEISKEYADVIEKEMRRMVSLALPFVKRSVPTAEAIRLFRERDMPDKEKLFRTRIASRVNIYNLNGYEDYYYGFMVHDASVLKQFELIPYKMGVILNLPKKNDPGVLHELEISEKLFNAQMMGEKWARRQDIGCVGDLNERIIMGEMSQTVLTSEALQEGVISSIAEKILDRGGVKFVMIAGPSSSGKTTFSQRLAVQLKAHGLKPHYIGVDNYFRNREDMKPGPDGKIDFEGLNAVDVEQFNKDMSDLLAGKRVAIPTFDFIEGKRVYTGETILLKEEDMLVIEGIHCLNDNLSYTLPKESKFLIYITALTQLCIDEHNRVPSADGRLIRRIVRDNRTRGYSASRTLAMWDSVRRGEEKNIFPYQESADVFFSSALPYEIAALKTYVTPLLFQVTPDDPSYQEAKRLLKFLDYFLAIPAEGIPVNSILREFIGGGCFRL